MPAPDSPVRSLTTLSSPIAVPQGCHRFGGTPSTLLFLTDHADFGYGGAPPTACGHVNFGGLGYTVVRVRYLFFVQALVCTCEQWPGFQLLLCPLS